MSPHDARLVYEALSDVMDRILIAQSKGLPDCPLTEKETYANRRLQDIAEYIDVKMAFVKPSRQRTVV